MTSVAGHERNPPGHFHNSYIISQHAGISEKKMQMGRCWNEVAQIEKTGRKLENSGDAPCQNQQNMEVLFPKIGRNRK